MDSRRISKETNTNRLGSLVAAISSFRLAWEPARYMPTFPLSATTLCLWDFFALCLFLRRSASSGMGGREALDRPTPSRKYFSFLIGLCIGRATMAGWRTRPSHVTSRRSEMVPRRSFYFLFMTFFCTVFISAFLRALCFAIRLWARFLLFAASARKLLPAKVNRFYMSDNVSA